MALDQQTKEMLDRFSAAVLSPEEMCDLASALARAVEGQGDDRANWYNLICVVAAMNDGVAALGLITAAAVKFDHPAAICYNVCSFLYKIQKYHAIRTLYNIAPENTVVRLIASYYMGCIAFKEDRKAEGHRYLDFFRTSSTAVLGQFLADPGLNVILRQGALVRAPDHVAQLAADPPASPILDISFVRTVIAPSDDLRPIYLFAADRKYLMAMLPTFLAKSPATPTDFVIVAVNVEAEHLAFIESQCGLYPLFSIDVVVIQSAANSATFHSCARFYALQAILPRYGRRVVSLDIDGALTPEGRSLLETASADIDFACFRSPRDEPASYYQAGVLLWGRGAATRMFLDLVCAFCSERAMENSGLTWMLDQAALFSVLHYMADRGLPLAFVPLNRLFGRPLADITVSTWDGGVNKGDLRGVLISVKGDAMTVAEL